MDLRHVAVVVWLLSWLGVMAAYVASALGGHVPDCVPHLAGCSSVSAAGRYGLGFFVFKATMLPVAGFLMVYWVLCDQWLRVCGDDAAAWRRWMLTLGVIGAVFLVLYTTFLGSEGEVYRALRRYGTVVFFGFTFLAELVLAYRARAVFAKSALANAKVVVCLVMLIEGLILFALKNFVEDDKVFENLAEWHIASALSFYPFLTWLMWRTSDFTVRFSVGRRG